jgi:hypothetical protein
MASNKWLEGQSWAPVLVVVLSPAPLAPLKFSGLILAAYTEGYRQPE